VCRAAITSHGLSSQAQPADLFCGTGARACGILEDTCGSRPIDGMCRKLSRVQFNTSNHALQSQTAAVTQAHRHQEAQWV